MSQLSNKIEVHDRPVFEVLSLIKLQAKLK